MKKNSVGEQNHMASNDYHRQTLDALYRVNEEEIMDEDEKLASVKGTLNLQMLAREVDSHAGERFLHGWAGGQGSAVLPPNKVCEYFQALDLVMSRLVFGVLLFVPCFLCLVGL